MPREGYVEQYEGILKSLSEHAIANTPQWGYLEQGNCQDCNREDVGLWTCSLRENVILCAECAISFIGGWFISSEDKVANYAQAFAVVNNPVSLGWEAPSERCETCEGLFVDSSIHLRKAIGHDANGDEMKVHASCVSKCGDCDVLFARMHYRYRANVTLMSMWTVDDLVRCQPCHEEYIASCGGQDQFFTCEACEDMHHLDNVYTFDSCYYCETCYENNVYYCDDCDESYWSDHDCQVQEDSYLIHSYSYKPRPHFFGSGKYHLGFELEIEARDNSRHDGALITQNALGERVYLKDDGSLEDGFEIVTHPHTLEEYHNKFDWSALSKLQREGFRSWNTTTCGLHVHVSRTAFRVGNRRQDILANQAHELRFMKLIYDNQRQVERIAGRSNNHYAQFTDKGKLVDKVKEGDQESGRYSAVNSENDDTLEVRVFRGSLRKERVLSALEFVHAAVEYTRDLKVTGKNSALSWLKFTGYVASNYESYPNLATIMSESFDSDSSTETRTQTY